MTVIIYLATNALFREWSHEHRRLRFSLRTLFVVVTVLGGSLGWLLYQFRWIEQRRDFLANEDVTIWDDKPAPWPLWLLGEPGHKTIVLYDNEGSPSPVERARSLFPESKVWGLTLHSIRPLVVPLAEPGALPPQGDPNRVP